MAWPASVGPWNPGLAMTPDMNMGSYTPDQWTAMQQQNWQQWAQWQQQYAQWQSQYGEKYAQQMQAMQAMGGPPLPAALPPAAPPPPDNPPPPPHENNMPLYTQNKTQNAQPSPVPPPPNKNTAPAPYSSTTGNNQNWSYEREQAAPQQTPVNTEALKKLAEEERLFDIQFQKWEEEIDKWRRENVNHPDKQAYKEYEAKFEACRLQLLERRSQMNQKKARLLGGAAPAAAATPTNTGNISTAVPPPLQNKTNYNVPSANNAQAQSYNNKIGNYSDNNTGQSYNVNKNTQNYQDKNAGQNYQDNRGTNYQQYNDSGYNKNTTVDPKERYDSYQAMEDYSQPGNYGDDSSNSSFLPQSSSNKGIPGLDLVPEGEKAPQQDDDVIVITQDAPQSRGMPDYSTISKGINNILGDEKLMNILSSIRGQPPPGPPPVVNNSQTISTPNANIGQGDYSNPPPNNQKWDRNNDNQWERNNDNNQWDRNNYNNQWNRNNDQNQYGNRQIPPNRQQDYGQNQNYQNQNYQNQNSYDDQSRGQDQWNYEDEGNYGQEGNYEQERNYGQDMNQRGGPPPRDNVPPPRGSGPPPRGNGPRPLMEVNLNMHDAGDVHDGYDAMSQRPVPPPPPRKPTWVEQPMFAPSIIVEYEHKPLRLKAREFIEPVHMFDYNHISKDGDNKKRDFEREADEMFSRKPRDDDYDRYSRDRHYHRPPPDREGDRYARDQSSQFERRAPREERDDYRPRVPPRDDFERRYPENRYDDRRRDDRDRNRRDDLYNRERDSFRERDRERDRERERDRLDRDRDNRDRYRDSRRSRSRDKDNRKRARSKESAISIISDDSIQSNSKKPKEVDDKNRKHVVMIDDLLEPPGRDMRPAKIVIILRGPPGSGKSYLAKLIRDREAEHGGTARIMSIDDYFMQEGEVEEKDPTTGKIVKKPSLKYEYDSKSEETYENSLKRAFKRSCTDGYFNFLIYDAVNDHLRSYADVWNFARQNGFQVYVCTMEMDAQVCYKRNIHNRSLEDIQVICARFFPTPPHHIQLDPTTLLQSAGITEVQMLDVEDDDDVIMEDVQHEVESSFTSKWEKMDDAAQLARLDGTSKPLRPSQLSMEDYLQLDDWKPNVAKPGKKTVRWADIEEGRQQEKMRAIGFVVGQTDWNRMTDPTMGSSALTQTKFIERVRRT